MFVLIRKTLITAIIRIFNVYPFRDFGGKLEASILEQVIEISVHFVLSAK